MKEAGLFAEKNGLFAEKIFADSPFCVPLWQQKAKKSNHFIKT